MGVGVGVGVGCCVGLTVTVGFTVAVSVGFAVGVATVVAVAVGSNVDVGVGVSVLLAVAVDFGSSDSLDETLLGVELLLFFELQPRRHKMIIIAIAIIAAITPSKAKIFFLFFIFD